MELPENAALMSRNSSALTYETKFDFALSLEVYHIKEYQHLLLFIEHI